METRSDRQQLQDKLIDMSQLCGIKEYTLENGPAEGVKVAEVYTGSGLTFSVLKSRGLDIADTRYRGIPLHFKSFGGITAPSESYARGSEFLRSFYGGLLVSCGMTYTGRPNVDQGEELSLHGRMTQLKARVSHVRADWDEDGGYKLEIGGEVRESAMFGPNASMRRTIRSAYNASYIEIEDVFTNHHNKSVPHAMLYHFTFGYPLVDEDARFVYHASSIQGLDDNVRDERTTDFKRIPAPMEEHDGAAQDFLYLDIVPDSEGMAAVGIINRKLGIGVKLEYPKSALPRLGNWQHFGHGEYVTAFEPMNSGVEGRAKDREQGWIEELPPGGSKTYRIRLTVLGSADEIERFASEYEE